MGHLNKESVKKLTELCRIDCTEEEQEAILKDLESVLAYVDLLQELNTDDVPPCNHVLSGIANVMRDDVIEKRYTREAFLSNAPEKTSGMIRVPPVIAGHHSQEMEG